MIYIVCFEKKKTKRKLLFFFNLFILFSLSLSSRPFATKSRTKPPFTSHSLHSATFPHHKSPYLLQKTISCKAKAKATSRNTRESSIPYSLSLEATQTTATHELYKSRHERAPQEGGAKLENTAVLEKKINPSFKKKRRKNREENQALPRPSTSQHHSNTSDRNQLPSVLRSPLCCLTPPAYAPTSRHSTSP